MSLFVLACAVLSMVLVGWWAPLVFWIGPQLLGQPFLRLYLLTEHTLCSMDDNGLTNTRTTLTNALVRLLMWNMSYPRRAPSVSVDPVPPPAAGASGDARPPPGAAARLCRLAPLLRSRGYPGRPRLQPELIQPG